MKDLAKIKERISDAIKHSGMTQVELAAKLHITQSTIAHYIKGDILPSLEIFANLCEVLDVSPEYLLLFE